MVFVDFTDGQSRKVGSGIKTKSVLGKDVFRCQERNSDRDQGTYASNILCRSLGKSIATRTRDSQLMSRENVLCKPLCL